MRAVLFVFFALASLCGALANVHHNDEAANHFRSLAVSCSLSRSSATTPTYGASHPRILVNHAETLSCLKSKLTSSDPAAVRFKSIVDTEMADTSATWDNPHTWDFQAWFSALLYKVTGTATYGTFAVKRIEAMVASEEALIAGGSRAIVADDSYLYVGRYVGDIALVFDWCYDLLTASQRTRYINYMNQAVYNVWNPDQAKWGSTVYTWSGWSIDNPSNNYYYSFLRATMLTGLATYGENTQANQWLTQWRTTKLQNQLVPTFNTDLVGGGSREGTGYGTAMRELFALYDLWERSTGERVATLTTHTLSSAYWFTHTIVPTLDRLAALGDHARESTAAFFDYHREYMLALMALFPNERISGVMKTVLDGSSVPKVEQGFEAWVDYMLPVSVPVVSVSELSTTYYGSGTGEIFMRSAWGDKKAAFSSLTCGPYTESHAHRDQGAFQIYRGEWLAPTANIYTKSGIQQAERINNLVRFEKSGGVGVQQSYNAKCQLGALSDNDQYTYALAKSTPMYTASGVVQKSEREYVFIKPGVFVVFDRATASAGVSKIFTLNMAGTPTINGDQLTFIGAGSNRMDVYRASPAGLSYTVNTPTLEDGDSLSYNPNAKRIDVVDTSSAQTNFLHVISTTASGSSNVVKSVVRNDATGQIGVEITFTDSTVAVVRFSTAGTGGTIELRSSTGAVLSSGSLATTVATLPLTRASASSSALVPDNVDPVPSDEVAASSVNSAFGCVFFAFVAVVLSFFFTE